MSNDKPFRAKNGIVAKRFLQKASIPTSSTENYRLDKLTVTNKYFNTNSFNTSPRQIFFSDDGLTMMLSGFSGGSQSPYSGNDFIQFTLTSPYDISTASVTIRNSQFSVVYAGNLTGNVETDINASFWKPDGTAFWYIGDDFETLTQIDVAEPWQLRDSQGNSNISYANKNLQLGPAIGGPTTRGLWFKPDGTKLYVLDDAYRIIEYDLSPAWDVSSATSVSTYNSFHGGNPLFRAMWISPDGSELWLSNSTDDEIQIYKFATPWDLSTLDFDSAFSDGLNNAGSVIFSLTVTPNGDKLIMVDNDINVIYEASIFANISSLELDKGTVFKSTPSVEPIIRFTNPAIAGKATSFTLDLDAGSANTGYNLSSTTPGSGFGYKGFQADGVNDVRSVRFNPDGTRMFILENHTTDNVWQYDLSTPWDTSTAVQNTNFYNLISVGGNPMDIRWKNDGTVLYVLNSGTLVASIEFSSPYDITSSTVGAIRNSNNLTNGAGMESFYISSDGLMMYILMDDRYIRSYSLSSPWEIFSCTLREERSLSANPVTPRGLEFNPNGNEFYVGSDDTGLGGRYIARCTLEGPWNLSSETLQYRYFGFGANDLRNFVFKPDGKKLFISNDADYAIEEVDTSLPDPLAVEWADNIKWEGGITPNAPALGEKSSYAFITIDGGTTYYAKEIAGELS